MTSECIDDITEISTFGSRIDAKTTTVNPEAMPLELRKLRHWAVYKRIPQTKGKNSF